MNVLTRFFLRIPTLIGIGLLVGLIVWGNHIGWKFPGTMPWHTSVEGEEEWCEAHGVPDARCIACHPELGGADPKDWCKEHGVPESKCTTCHPEILKGGTAKDWCREHGVPESGCTVCHPEIAVKGEVVTEPDIQVIPAHDGGTTHDPLTCQNHLRRVQFASPEAVKKAGIELESAKLRPVSQFIATPGELAYDQTRVARVSSRVGGIVILVTKEVGEAVKQGEVLAVVDSAEVGLKKAELLQAAAQLSLRTKALDRLRVGAKEGYRAQSELQEAEAAAREARIQWLNSQQALMNLGFSLSGLDVTSITDDELATRMRHLGLSADLMKAIGKSTESANLIPITSPMDGVVVSRDVVSGEAVELSRPIFTVADLRRMWVMLDARAEDAQRIQLDQEVRFEIDGGSLQPIVGKVSWISTALDEKTRTVGVRAEVDNKEGRLRASTFGTGQILVRREPSAVTIPEEAIQWEGCSFLAFVRLTDDIFQTRRITLGSRSAGFVEVLAGVADGEVVVTTGSYVLKSEVMKSAMGAGCVDD